MFDAATPLHRRSVLVRLAGWGAAAGCSALLGGCGGGSADGGAADAPVTVTNASAAATSTAAAAAAIPADDNGRLNFVLNLGYLATQFHTIASGGAVPGSLLTGVGRQGSVAGARAASLADPLVAATASALAADKQAHLAALRTQLGGAAAAMPALDFGVASGGSLSRLASAAGVTLGAVDPFADDSQFLLGAFVIDDAIAATQRTLLPAMQSADAATVLEGVLADAIHHGGLLRTLLDRRAVDDPTLATTVASLCAALAKLDGSAGGDQTLAAADTGSANLVDADGRPIPFTRSPGQALRLAFLDPTAMAGGFFPSGFNGVG